MVEPVGNAADLRAMMLQVMQQHAAIEPRGFDSIKARQRLQAEWDELYEDYLLEAAAECEPVS